MYILLYNHQQISLFLFMLKGPLGAGIQGASLMVRSQLLSAGTVYSVCNHESMSRFVTGELGHATKMSYFAS